MKYYSITSLIMTVLCLQFSCKDFVEIDPPKSSLVQETVFQNNDQATSALTGIYSVMASSTNYASGGTSSISALAGLSADELQGYSATNTPFYQNKLNIENSYIASLYSGPYKTIYTANAILEGLSAPNGVTPPVKAQLEGEAYFIRAFAYFYLTNLYGPVPLQLSTDYRVTQLASRLPEKEVYQQILNDLIKAESLLSDSYPTTGRVRPNKSAAQAMRSRVYLYLKDWSNAEKQATLILDKTGTYSLTAPEGTFLPASKEAIWQLMPAAGSNTQEGSLFILTGTPTVVSLRKDFAENSFETGDKRKSEWIRSLSNTTGTYYYPFKYKIKSAAATAEYSVVLRLAEQYLIRAEARAAQDNLDGAIADLDQIRNRAGLKLISVINPTISKPDLLTAILKERRNELFSEWGHRWLDLKRTGMAQQTLLLSKPGLRPTDLLYPIPLNELRRNPNITQNDSYPK